MLDLKSQIHNKGWTITMAEERMDKENHDQFVAVGPTSERKWMCQT